MRPHLRARGITLVELMITLAVLAIGMALAYPSFTGVIRSNRVATGTNDLLAAFNLARTEALRSNRGAGVCPSATGGACAGGDWNSGTLVFTDMDSNGSWSAGDVAVRHFEARPGLALTAEADGGGAALVTEVAFDRRGRVVNAVDITLIPENCPAGLSLERHIVVSRAGQTRMVREECE